MPYRTTAFGQRYVTPENVLSRSAIALKAMANIEYVLTSEQLARWYGCKDYGKPELDESKLTTVDPGDRPTPLGFGPPVKPRFSFTLGGWASKDENHKAWKEIMQKHNLTDDPFEGDLEAWQFADAAAWALSLALSMNKALNFGWTGHVDTLESLHLAYSELNKIGMLPPLVGESRPLI